MRTARGVYTIEPNDPNRHHETATGGIYWSISGTSLWGQRFRKRPQNWTAALTYRDLWEKADIEWLKTHKQVAVPAVIVSKELSQEVLAQATRAYHKLPMAEDGKTVDPRYRLDEGIEFALACGWNPTLGSDKVKDLLPGLIKHQEWRASLPWTDNKRGRHIGKSTLAKNKQRIKHCSRMFGEETLSCVNSKQRQRKILDDLNDVSAADKASASAGLSLLLRWLKDSGRLGKLAVEVYRFELMAQSIPKVMNIFKQQEYLDMCWKSKMAAAGVARLFLGVRPWSELKQSKSDMVAYGLTPDCRTFLVPIDGKTGWRPVSCPPIAALLFEQLKKEGRLFKSVDAEGNMLLMDGGTSSWTYFYGRLGYKLGAGSLKSAIPMTKRKHLSDEAILAYFRESYPQKYDHEFVPDYPRHTNTSAFVEISLGMVDAAATYHGNSRKKIEDHYRGRMSLAEAIVHYRLLPTALKGTYRPEDVPLPKWSQIDIDKLDEADNKEMPKLYGNLPRFDPSVDYGRNGGRTELQRQRSSNSQKERWAKVKARDDWTDKKKKMQTAVAKARLGLNGAVRAKAGKGRWEKLKSQGDWPDRKAKLVMSLQKALPKKVEMGLVKAAPEATTLQASDFSAA